MYQSDIKKIFRAYWIRERERESLLNKRERESEGIYFVFSVNFICTKANEWVNSDLTSHQRLGHTETIIGLKSHPED